METDESFETNLNTVKEMILDEEKIVSYVSLSKDLCIHINNSKKLLHCFVNNIPKQYPNVKLNINYIISGITKENKAQTTVCIHDDLQILKKSFKTTFYKHIYSVSKGFPQTDHTAYLLLSKFDDFNLCAGLIKNSECSKHTSDEIGNLKHTSQQNLSIESKDSVGIPQKKVKSESKNVTDIIKVNVVKTNSNSKDGEKLKLNTKTENISPIKETVNNKQNSIKNNNLKTHKGIAGFFNKPNISKNQVLKEPAHQPNITLEKSFVVKEEKMETNVENHKNNKVLNHIKKTSKIDKKRKRVLHVSDSESDEDNDSSTEQKVEIRNESEDEIPSTPSVNNIKITSGIVNPKKRRKVVDKTYTDEDGYILTKKEEIYESCSENEEDTKVKENVNVKKEKSEKAEISPKAKKNGTTSNKKKISPPQKGKQTTLAHFFTKK